MPVTPTEVAIPRGLDVRPATVSTSLNIPGDIEDRKKKSEPPHWANYLV
jgi:hypothetical protein